MKRILCYGDSNTWGYDPVSLDRFDEHTRWTRVLGRSLGNGYEVIEEGLNGRTTVWDDPIEGYKSGKEYLIPCLESHKPLDLVAILLGTNDLKMRFSLSAFDAAEGARVLVGIVQKSLAGVAGRSPQALLLAPPPTTRLNEYAEMFKGAEEKSKKFSYYYGRVAQEMGCAFLDTGTVIASSPLDGIHFEAGEHRKLGQAVALKARELLE
jgi:lysophospholipase L1-like esterase